MHSSFSCILAVLEANYSPVSLIVRSKILCVLRYSLKSFELPLQIRELLLHHDVSTELLQLIYRQPFGVAGQGKVYTATCSSFSFLQLSLN